MLIVGARVVAGEAGVCVPEAELDVLDLAPGSFTMVDCDAEREKVFASGVRWVPLSSSTHESVMATMPGSKDSEHTLGKVPCAHHAGD